MTLDSSRRHYSRDVGGRMHVGSVDCCLQEICKLINCSLCPSIFAAENGIFFVEKGKKP